MARFYRHVRENATQRSGTVSRRARILLLPGRFRQLPADEQRPAPHGDARRRRDDVIAHTEREAAVDRPVRERILQPLERDVLGAVAHTEERDNAPVHLARERERLIFDGGVDEILVVEITPCPMTQEKGKRLEVGERVVEPRAARRAIEIEGIAAAAKSLAEREHGVGVVLFDRHADAVRRRLTDVHRVKVPEHEVRLDAEALTEQKPRIRGDLKLARAGTLPQTVKGARGVDKAAFHGFPSPGWFMVLIVT